MFYRFVSSDLCVSHGLGDLPFDSWGSQGIGAIDWEPKENADLGCSALDPSRRLFLGHMFGFWAGKLTSMADTFHAGSMVCL